MSTAPKTRPKYYDLNLTHYPPPGIVSILHRISGVALFFPILPGLLYIFEGVLGTPESYAEWQQFVSRPLVKLVLVGVIWAYAHHFWAGIRYLLLDLHVGIDRQPSRTTAVAVLVLGVATTVLVAWRCL